MVLLIMAAGLGSRYGGLKQLDGVGPNNELLIEYAIYDAIQAGFDKVVCIIKEENEADFEEKISHKIRPHIEIEYVYQNTNNVPEQYKSLLGNRTKPLGTGHAILCAKEAIGDDTFAVINADDFYSRDAFVQLFNYMEISDNYCLSGFQLQNTVSENGVVSRGVCSKDTDSYLTKIIEHEKIDSDFVNHAEPFVTLTPDTTVSMNCWGFKSNAFDVFEKAFYEFLETNKENFEKCEFYLASPINKVIQDNIAKIKVLETSAVWYGVTYKEDKEPVVAAIQQMINEGIYPERLWN
ncbi:MAG: sugar phosphate nucleotidyltransferase [Eubacteriales bacterium]